MKDIPAFKSSLSKYMVEFVKIKRLSGTDYQSQTNLLRKFDNFIFENYNDSLFVTHDIFRHYLATLNAMAGSSQVNNVSVVRQFCKQLSLSKKQCFIPGKVPLKKYSACFPPYIFDKGEICAILEAAQKLGPPGTLRPVMYHALFALLYATGMRTREARGLNVGDYYPQQKLLHVRCGKYNKERWVPASNTLSGVLDKYLERRMNEAEVHSEAPLFVTLKGTRVAHGTAVYAFKKVIAAAHLDSRKSYKLYDLRHTFTSHRLLEWYKDGKDINTRLPLLSTYMGHLNLFSTQKYIQITPDLQREVNKKFHAHFCLTVKD